MRDGPGGQDPLAVRHWLYDSSPTRRSDTSPLVGNGAYRRGVAEER